MRKMIISIAKKYDEYEIKMVLVKYSFLNKIKYFKIVFIMTYKNINDSLVNIKKELKNYHIRYKNIMVILDTNELIFDTVKLPVLSKKQTIDYINTSSNNKYSEFNAFYFPFIKKLYKNHNNQSFQIILLPKYFYEEIKKYVSMINKKINYFYIKKENIRKYFTNSFGLNNRYLFINIKEHKTELIFIDESIIYNKTIEFGFNNLEIFIISNKILNHQKELIIKTECSKLIDEIHKILYFSKDNRIYLNIESDKYNFLYEELCKILNHNVYNFYELKKDERGNIDEYIINKTINEENKIYFNKR